MFHMHQIFLFDIEGNQERPKFQATFPAEFLLSFKEFIKVLYRLRIDGRDAKKSSAYGYTSCVISNQNTASR